MRDGIPSRFSDEQAKAILARAIEIDSRAPMTTTDDLRAIASELGVSPASLDAALREQATAMRVQHLTAGRRPTTAVAAVGVPLGFATAWLLGAGTGLASLGLMGVGLVASAGLVVLGANGTLRSFHLKNLALWTGVAAGGLASVMLSGGELTRMPALIIAGWCIRSWIASSVLGSAAVIAVKRARRPESPDRDQLSSGTPALTIERGWARAAKKVLGWITRPFRRDNAQVRLAKA